MKINKTESISSGIISEVSFVLLFQSFELLWRFTKSDPGDSCWTVSHTHTDLQRQNDFLHQLVPVHWPEAHSSDRILIVMEDLLKKRKKKWHVNC